VNKYEQVEKGVGVTRASMGEAERVEKRVGARTPQHNRPSDQEDTPAIVTVTASITL
jgi:hypothetical protein